jgi:hypothetical protein
MTLEEFKVLVLTRTDRETKQYLLTLAYENNCHVCMASIRKTYNELIIAVMDRRENSCYLPKDIQKKIDILGDKIALLEQLI